MYLSFKQKGVMRGAAMAAGVVVVVLSMAIYFNPFASPENLGLQQRLLVAVNADLLVVLCLAAAICRLANHRFFTAEDIDGSGLTSGTDRAKLLQALLQNTLEQAVLASVVYLAWAILLPSRWLSVIPVAALTFTIGRIAFFAAYERGAATRAFGFGLTFYPSVGLLICLIVRSVWSLAGT